MNSEQTAIDPGLAAFGLHGLAKEHWNLSVPALYDQALTRGEARLAQGGPLVATTGSRTGRSPQDRFIVQEASTAGDIAWGETNKPVTPRVFDSLLSRVTDYFSGREVFIQDLQVGADRAFRLPIRVITEQAWHSLFAHNMFIRPKPEDLRGFVPRFTVLQAPGFMANPARDGTRSEAFIMLNFAKRLVLIGGTRYA